MPVKVLMDETENESLKAGVKEAKAIAKDAVAYNWEKAVKPSLKAKAQQWAKDLNVEAGDIEIMGFADDLMTEISDISAKILAQSKQNQIPEATAIFNNLIDKLDSIDYNKLNDSSYINRTLKAIQNALQSAVDEFHKLLDNISSIESRIAEIEAEIKKLMALVDEYIENLQKIKANYVKNVPYITAAVYAMQLVIEREEVKLEELKAKAKKFKEENQMANNEFENDVWEKQTQIDLCRERFLQLSYLAAKGYIMVPVIDILLKAGRLIREQMYNAVKSTLPDVRATLAVIAAQFMLEKGNEVVEKAERVQSKATEALIKRLNKTTQLVAQMPAKHAEKMQKLVELAETVNESRKAIAQYSEDLKAAIIDVNKSVTVVNDLLATSADEKKLKFTPDATELVATAA